MSKSLGDVLRWFRAVDGTTLGCVELSLPQVTALAAVLDAADAMEAQHPHAQRPFDHDTFGIAAYRVARAALAEALKEGR